MARRKKTEKRELSHEDIPRNTRATARRLLGRMARQWWKLLLVAGAALLKMCIRDRLKALRTHLSKLPQLSSFVALQRIVKYMGYGDYLSSQGGDKSRVELLLALARHCLLYTSRCV